MTGKLRPDLLSGSLTGNIIRLGAPVALASVIQTLYNLADTFWLGRLGPEAVSAPVITFTVVFFIISIGIGLAVAGTSLVSQYTGARKPDQVHFTAGNLMVILVGLSLLFSLIGVFFDEFLLRMLKTPVNAFAETRAYFNIMFMGMPLAFPFFVYQSVMHGYGDTRSPLKIELVSAALNIILDPLLIFGVAGFPALGVEGAAVTTVLSRGVASVIGLSHLFSGKKGIRISLTHLRPQWSLIRSMMRIGMPAAIGMAGTSLGFLVLMGFVNQFGIVVVSVYGIGTRMVHVFMMPAIGVSKAITTIVGQNLGAGQPERARKTVTQAMKILTVIIMPAMALIALNGARLTAVFIPQDPLVHEIGGVMFRFVSPAVIFFTLGTVINGAFQGAGYTFPVMVANILRIWLFRIPLVYLIAMVLMSGPADIHASLGVWLGILISNCAAFGIIYFWYRKKTWLRARIHSQVG